MATRRRYTRVIARRFGKVRDPQDLTTCSDVDMKSSNADGRFVHKDGTPYSRS